MTASKIERAAVARTVPVRRRTVALVVTTVVALAVGARFVSAILVNAPAAPATLPREPIAGATTGLAALAALWLGASGDDPVAGVGLLFVGVFGLLAAAVGLATPAAVAVATGTGVVAVGFRRRLTVWTGAATALLVAAVAVGLAAGFGWPGLRPLGSTLALLGIAATPLYAGAGPRAVGVGAGAFAVVVAVGLANPFVAGATTLVGSGVVGTSLVVVGLAVAGAVTAASVALRERRFALLVGVALLAFAGVPATLSRAVPFALGIATLLSLEVER
ncbi:phosphate ABC transporter permease [Halomicrobium sp. HM KBTZ05]|uniref:phosphate ABC transporter permease n=1 Tax=Halomicrobium sp. HM KBTZ05 TaxID=3242663 RepID=UPI003558D552